MFLSMVMKVGALFVLATVVCEGRKLDGTFLFPAYVPEESVEAFLDELEVLQMSVIVVANSRWLPYGTTCPSTAFAWSANTSYVRKLLDGAASRNMEVWLGLSQDTTGSTDCWKWFEPPQLNHTLEDVRFLLQTFHDVGGLLDHSALAGWYFPQEPYLTNPTWISYMFDAYRRTVQEVRKLSTLPTMVSPYLVDSAMFTPDELAARAAEFANETGIDIQAWQDSVGADNIPPERVADFFTAFEQRLGKNKLWADVEAFNWGPDGLDTGGSYRPASIVRFTSQIDRVATHSNKVIVWLEQMHFGLVDTHRFEEADRMHAAYRGFMLGNSNSELVIPRSCNINNNTENCSKLFDREIARPGDANDLRWAVIELNDRSTASINVEFERVTTVLWVAVHLLSNDTVSAAFPTRITLSIANASSYWTQLGTWASPVQNGLGEYVLGNLEQVPTPQAAMRLRITLQKPLSGSICLRFLASEVEIIAKAYVPTTTSSMHSDSTTTTSVINVGAMMVPTADAFFIVIMLLVIALEW